MIKSQELRELDSSYVIRTREDYKEVTSDMIAQIARNHGMSAGDPIRVQCFDHGYAQMYAETEFVVVSRKDEFKIRESTDFGNRQGTVSTFEVVQKGDWYVTSYGKERESELKKKKVA